MDICQDHVDPLAALSDAIVASVETAGRHVVGVGARRRGQASGVGWRNGIIVTADHVVQREDSVKIVTPDGKKLDATLLGRDPSTDLAVLQVPDWGSGSTPVFDNEPKPGQLVVAIGRPSEHGVSVSFGVLSSVGGEFRTHGGSRIDRYIRPDVTFYPGFSGGPLVAAKGRIVGINTSGLAHSSPMTVPAVTVDRVVDEIQKSGHIRRGYLGLRMQAVDLGTDLTSRLKLSSNLGLLVVAVEADGPGSACVFVGDVVTSVGGKGVGQSDEVVSLLEPGIIGQTVTLQLVRGGNLQDVPVVVGERPQRGRRRE